MVNINDKDTLTFEATSAESLANNPLVAGSTESEKCSLSANSTIHKTTISSVPNVHDVAAYILQKCGTITAMKLQKLVYYCQAWSLVWDDAPLFNERIEAWANGPVVPALYTRHRGMFEVKSWIGDISRFDANQIETMDKVLEFYANKSSQVLSDLTHQEAPWREARKGLSTGERGNAEITLASMVEYYSSL